MQHNGLISIFIPVYNVKPYLGRCMESLVSQTYSRLEIILVDDGSRDGSTELCDAWAKKDNRVDIIHRENGRAAARNSGLDVAKGDYIMFVDADDYVADDICSMLLNEMHRCLDVDCVICGLAFVDDNGPVGTQQAVETPELLSGIDTIKDRYVLNRNRINIIGPFGKLFRREIWNDLRFTNGMYYEDLDIMPYLFTRCRNVSCIPDIGYYYQRAGSASHGTGTDDKRVIDSLLIRDKHIAFFDQIGQYDISNSVRRMLMDLIITSDCNGWIPKAYTDVCHQLVRKHWKAAASSAFRRSQLRYCVYRFCGVRTYKLLAQ